MNYEVAFETLKILSLGLTSLSQLLKHPAMKILGKS